jgi:hypothetical protein
MIDCTGIDLVKLAQEAYRLSVPQGLGFLHFTSEPLSVEEAKTLVNLEGRSIVLDMDYVHGRAVKLCVRKNEGGTLSLPDSWYDHTDEQYRELLQSVGIGANISAEHGCACNCESCRLTRMKGE